MEMLQVIPGIGPVRARALLARFGGIRALVAGSLDEIAEVHGLGRVMAARVHRIVDDGFEQVGDSLTR